MAGRELAKGLLFGLVLVFLLVLVLLLALVSWLVLMLSLSLLFRLILVLSLALLFGFVLLVLLVLELVLVLVSWSGLLWLRLDDCCPARSSTSGVVTWMPSSGVRVLQALSVRANARTDMTTVVLRLFFLAIEGPPLSTGCYL